MKQVIVIAGIKDTKNSQVKQLELRTVIEKPAEANPVAFFLAGVPNVAPSTETRVYWQSVSTDFITQKGLQVGDNFGEKIGFPNARLVVKETYEARTWTNSDGSAGKQTPKMNPQTGVVLTKDGKDIYRNVELSLDGKMEDAYIQHDIAANSSSSSSIAEMASKGASFEPSLK